MVSVMGKRGLFLVWLCLVNILPGMAQTEKLIDYVNPLWEQMVMVMCIRVRRFLSGEFR